MKETLTILIVILIGIIYLKYVEVEEMNKIKEKLIEKQKTIENISKEHQKPKHKVSQLEYDILELHLKYDLKFYQSKELYALLKKGYFKGATKDMSINYYLDNCEVKEDV